MYSYDTTCKSSVSDTRRSRPTHKQMILLMQRSSNTVAKINFQTTSLNRFEAFQHVSRKIAVQSYMNRSVHKSVTKNS